MTTERMRTTITVSPEVHEIFSRMAEAGGMSLARCIGDWLEDTSEGAALIAQKMQEARRAPRVVMREIHAMALGLVDEAAAAIEEVRRRSAAGAGGQPAAGAGRRSPPVSNTGGKSPNRGARGGKRP